MAAASLGWSVIGFLRGNQVISNIASTGRRGFGGGFQLEQGHATVEYNTFAGNTASAAMERIPGVDNDYTMIGYGGAINFRGCAGVCSMHHNIVKGNVASEHFSGYGGGISVRFDPILLDSNVIINNWATHPSSFPKLSWGGGVRVDRVPFLTMTNNIIAQNYAESEGGGIHIWGTTTEPIFAQLVHNTLAQNDSGPNDRANVAVYLLGNVTALMTNNILANHTYGIYLEDFEGDEPQTTADYTLFYDNSVNDIYGNIMKSNVINAPPGLY